ncbi:MAG: LamG-like jellyroll fold domain-containing protein [Kiritimatiellia bacterium]
MNTPHPNELPKSDFIRSVDPDGIPGLVSFWNFTRPGETFCAQQGEPYCLHSQSGPLQVVEDPGAGFGGRALYLDGGQWLSIPRRECPELDIHGKDGHVTVVAWIKRIKIHDDHCEFIAGQWNETNRGRQYGLFLNISVWGPHDRIFGHLSHVGGPTPGYRYCMDGAMGATPVPEHEWVTVAMSYDGRTGSAWLNGVLDVHPRLNPYAMAGGLHDGGTSGSDFTVGAVDRSGEIGNYFKGHLAALAVYKRALTPAEHYVLSQSASESSMM